MTLNFIVPGPPRPKERARKGKGGRFYTPPRTVAYEKHVGMCALKARQDAERYNTQAGEAFAAHGNAAFGTRGAFAFTRWPLGARYSVTIEVGQADARRIDLDNCIKAGLDGCNGVLWDDDSQVDEIHATRKIVERPCVLVRVEVLR